MPKSEDPWFMNAPCPRCPFRHDVEPFLSPQRGEELAYATANPYSDFDCHKTISHDEDGQTIRTPSSLTCAGFLSMQVNNGKRCPDGFVPSDLVYDDPYAMADAHQGEQ